MSKIVFILGAGASAEAGAPLMDNFLDVARNLRTRNIVYNPSSFDLVFDAISDLQIVHSKSKLDIYNIEHFFSTFEMAKILNCFFNYKKKEINNLIKSIRYVITETIQSSMIFPIKVSPDHNPTPYPPPYREFVELIRDLNQKNELSFITFNYDIALDFSLNQRQLSYTYSLEENDPIETKLPIKLLKLHGSLNWGFCSHCKKIVPWGIDDFLKPKHNGPTFINTSGGNNNYYLPIGSKIGKYQHTCNNNLLTEPVIVPPTWNKTDYSNMLSKVWSQAALELSGCEYIVIIGYSYPETDLFFHYLFALGSVGKPLQKILVINKDPKNEERFKSMLGLGAVQRFKFINSSFGDSIKNIGKELKN